MKCTHCGYSDSSSPDHGNGGDIVCPQCGAPIELDVARPVAPDTAQPPVAPVPTPELKVAKAVHVGFGDFVGNLAANVTVSGAAAKDAPPPTQTKLMINLRELNLDEVDSSSSGLSTDDMLLGTGSVYGSNDSDDSDDDSDIVDYYTEIQQGFDERQRELDELEMQLRQREENIAEQEKRLEAEIKLNRESAEDYISAKKMYETQNNIPAPRIIPAREVEKSPSPSYLHAFLSALAGICILLLIIVLFLTFALQNANQHIDSLHQEIARLAPTESIDPLQMMQSDFHLIQPTIGNDPISPEEARQFIHILEDFLNKYANNESLANRSEILSAKLQLDSCKKLFPSSDPNQTTSSISDEQEK